MTHAPRRSLPHRLLTRTALGLGLTAATASAALAQAFSQNVFGQSIALSDNGHIAVGAEGSEFGLGQGNAYIFCSGTGPGVVLNRPTGQGITRTRGEVLMSGNTLWVINDSRQVVEWSVCSGAPAVTDIFRLASRFSYNDSLINAMQMMDPSVNLVIQNAGGYLIAGILQGDGDATGDIGQSEILHADRMRQNPISMSFDRRDRRRVVTVDSSTNILYVSDLSGIVSNPTSGLINETTLITDIGAPNNGGNDGDVAAIYGDRVVILLENGGAMLYDLDEFNLDEDLPLQIDDGTFLAMPTMQEIDDAFPESDGDPDQPCLMDGRNYSYADEMFMFSENQFVIVDYQYNDSVPNGACFMTFDIDLSDVDAVTGNQGVARVSKIFLAEQVTDDNGNPRAFHQREFNDSVLIFGINEYVRQVGGSNQANAGAVAIFDREFP